MQLLRLNPGDITVCTYDERRNTGGKRKTYLQVMLTGFDEPGKQPVAAEKFPPSGANNKTPNFKANATTNIRCKNGDTVTIHPCLIEYFNDKLVTL